MNKEKIKTIGAWTIVVILVIILVMAVITLIGLHFYCLVTYGGKPISEIPTWALWFIWG